MVAGSASSSTTSPWRTSASFRERCPPREFADVSKPAMRMRMVKSDEEIAWIRESARHRRCRRRGLRGGRRGRSAGVRGGPARDPAMVRGDRPEPPPAVELMDTWDLVPVRRQHRRRPQPRDLAEDRARRHPEPELLSDAGRLLHGAGAHAVRRGVLRRRTLRLWKINVEVHEAGIGLIKPGARCCDIAAELNAIYERHGLLGKTAPSATATASAC